MEKTPQQQHGVILLNTLPEVGKLFDYMSEQNSEEEPLSSLVKHKHGRTHLLLSYSADHLIRTDDSIQTLIQFLYHTSIFHTMPARCFCGILSITAGAQICAVLMAIGAVQMFISSLSTDSYSFENRELWATTAVCLIELIVAVLVCIACNKDYSILMLPVVAFAAFRLFYVLLALFLGIYGIVDQHTVVPNWFRLTHRKTTLTNVFSNSTKQFEQEVFISTVKFTAWSSVDLVLVIWFINVLICCYMHLTTRPYNRLEM